MKLSLTLFGAPRTKKTSNRIVRAGGYPRVLPSKAFEEWNKSVQLQMLDKRSWKVNDGDVGIVLPYAAPVNCCALFYRNALRGDATGFYQALADALEEARVVENDKLITQWDGSRLLKDVVNPRIEVTLVSI